MLFNNIVTSFSLINGYTVSKNLSITSLIEGRHIDDCLMQYEAMSTNLCNCSLSYLPSSFGSASSTIFPDSMKGFTCKIFVYVTHELEQGLIKVFLSWFLIKLS